MQLGSEQVVPAGQERTWQALNDPEILRQCIPGCEAIVPADEPDAYRVEMAAKIGPVSAKFKGKLRLLDIQAPDSYRLEFEGQGGAADFGKGKAAVRLEPMGPQTKLHYSVDASVGGKLAQVGSRLIESAARKLSEDFLGKFNAVLAAEQPAAVEAVAAPEAAPELAVAGGAPAPTAAPAEAPSGGRGFNWIWLAGAALVAAAVAAAVGMR
jgi:carbon monoxide dehydrogenase subunit G